MWQRFVLCPRVAWIILLYMFNNQSYVHVHNARMAVWNMPDRPDDANKAHIVVSLLLLLVLKI